jgi:hypothetical protein
MKSTSRPFKEGVFLDGVEAGAPRIGIGRWNARGGRGRYGDDDELDGESDAAYTDADTCLKKLTGVLTTHPAQACAIRFLCEEALLVMDKQVNEDCGSENVHARVESLTALHVAAARQENPEPLAFAAKLLDLDLTSPATAFGSSRKTYGRILGKPGLAEYIRLARAKWAALSDKQKREDWQLKRLVLELAEDEQNLDAVVAIKSAKLENLFDYEALAKSSRFRLWLRFCFNSATWSNTPPSLLLFAVFKTMVQP